MENTRRYALIGHSSAGKSAILDDLGVDRIAADMDVFCSRNKLPYSQEAFVAMLENSPEICLFSVSNHQPLFPRLANLKLQCKVQLIYLHRPATILYGFRQQKNTDGFMASNMSKTMHQELYSRWHYEYLRLADFVFNYERHDLGELISLLSEFIRSINTRAEELGDVHLDKAQVGS